MSSIQHLFENNRLWSENQREINPEYFQHLSQIQKPQYLWIGCSDSRVPANQITGLEPGEVFVHRNIGNVVVHSDLNCLSVLQFAVDILQVKDILVVGHYGCGGVLAAMNKIDFGLSDNWIRHIRDVHYKHFNFIEDISIEQQKYDLLCELNVIEQALNVCHTTVLRSAWSRDQDVMVHAWVYGLKDGLINNLGFSNNGQTSLMENYKSAVNKSFERARAITPQQM